MMRAHSEKNIFKKRYSGGGRDAWYTWVYQWYE